MFVLRFLVERLFALVFSIAGTAAVSQGLAMLVAVLAAFVIPGRADAPPWLTVALFQTGLLSAVFFVAGFVLSGLRARAPKVSWRAVDTSLRREWVWPALVPTIGLPLFALSLSYPLLPLWRDWLAVLDRIGFSDFQRGAESWLLLPLLAILFVPLLESIAAFFLCVLPPLVLVLLLTRSPFFRLNAQRLVVAQGALATASLLAAPLFTRFANLAIPPIQKEGGAEAEMIVAALTRGREVLWETAVAHALVAAAYAACLAFVLHARTRLDPAEAVLSSSHDGSALLGDSPGRDPR